MCHLLNIDLNFTVFLPQNIECLCFCQKSIIFTFSDIVPLPTFRPIVNLWHLFYRTFHKSHSRTLFRLSVIYEIFMHFKCVAFRLEPDLLFEVDWKMALTCSDVPKFICAVILPVKFKDNTKCQHGIWFHEFSIEPFWIINWKGKLTK